MKKASVTILKIIGILLAMLLSYSCQQTPNNKITIATASNMQYAVKPLTEAFTAKTNIGCNIVVGSSGKLTNQILNHAPYDVFLAADMQYPQKIYDSNLSVQPPKSYALGNLVLWSMDSKPSLNKLTNQNIKHIAIANPQNAPYGQVSKEVLERSNIYNIIKDKLVYGESIAQTNQFITSETAQIGFTSLSTVLSLQMKDKGCWTRIDSKYHNSLPQGVLVIKNENSTKAQQFQDFLFTVEAQKILEANGFSIK